MQNTKIIWLASRLEPEEPSPCLASGRPTCCGRRLRQDDEDMAVDGAEAYCEQTGRLRLGAATPEEARRLVEWRRRHRLRGRWHLRCAVEVATSAVILGFMLLLTPGKYVDIVFNLKYLTLGMCPLKQISLGGHELESLLYYSKRLSSLSVTNSDLHSVKFFENVLEKIKV